MTSPQSPSVSVIGLGLALFGVLMIAVALDRQSFLPPSAATFLGAALVWLLSAFVIFIVLNVENRPLASIGLKDISGKEAMLAVVLGIVCALTVPLLTLLASRLIPLPQEGSIAATSKTTPVLLLLFSILTAGVCEEILYRGYLLERIGELTGRTWVAVSLSVIAFVLPHLIGWNTAHVVGVVLPLAFVLTGLYLWKRNLIFAMIVHIVIDTPLVFIALLKSF